MWFKKCGFICVSFGNPECLVWGSCPPERTPVTLDHFSLCWGCWVNVKGTALALLLAHPRSPDSRICSQTILPCFLTAPFSFTCQLLVFFCLLMVLVGLQPSIDFFVPIDALKGSFFQGSGWFVVWGPNNDDVARGEFPLSLQRPCALSVTCVFFLSPNY